MATYQITRKEWDWLARHYPCNGMDRYSEQQMWQRGTPTRDSALIAYCEFDADGREMMYFATQDGYDRLHATLT